MNWFLGLIMFIFVFSAFQGIVVSQILWFIRKSKGNRALSIFVFLFSLSLLDWVGYWTDFYKHYPVFKNISAPFTAFFGPLLWYYYSYSFHKSIGRYPILHWILPAIIIVKFVPYYLITWFGINSGLRFLSDITIINGVEIYPFLNIASMLIYGIVVFKKYMPFIRPEQKRWHYYLMSFYFAFVASWLLYIILNLFVGKIYIYFDVGIAFGMVLFIIGFSVLAYIQPGVFEGKSIIQAIRNIKYQKSGLSESQIQHIINKLNSLMNTRIYKETNLTLDSLAAKTKFTKHHISQAINEGLNISVSDYINSFRIEEAKMLLKTTANSEMNIIQIAYEVGFNNKNTFNNAFKKVTGGTASEYREVEHS